MTEKVLIVTATREEALALKMIEGMSMKGENFCLGNLEISLLVTGVGSVSTSWSLLKWFSSNQKPGLVINAGIAGSYRQDIVKGEVVTVVSDCFADAGIEHPGGFMTLSEMNLEDPDLFPYREGKIWCENSFTDVAKNLFRPVNAITVNTASGSQQTIEKLRKKFDPDIETMEGATFFYICSGEKTPFLALRAISNMVEPRDTGKWDIDGAIRNLSEGLKRFILSI